LRRGIPSRRCTPGIEALVIHARGKNAIDIATGHSNTAAYRIALQHLALLAEVRRAALREQSSDAEIEKLAT